MNTTSPIGKNITVYPPTQSNQITKGYYNFLVGEINRGTTHKAVCCIENKHFGAESYYLTSER